MTTYPVDAHHGITDGDPPLLLRDGVPVRMTTTFRHLAERTVALIGHDSESTRVSILTEMLLSECVRSSLYAVAVQKPRRVFDGSFIRDGPAELGRHRFLDDRVHHVDLEPDDPDMPFEEHFARLCQVMAPCALLGVKLRASGSSAVFLEGDFEDGLIDAFGEQIAGSVLDEDRLDRIQFLTLLCHREGQRASVDVPIRFPRLVCNDPVYDGLVADLDHAAWEDLLEAFRLPHDVYWLQATILDREQGIATKGALRKCAPNHQPATYRESWKIGLPSGPVPSTSILVMESDRTYKPSASLNLQQVAYNFDPLEQQALLDTVFIPGVQDLLDYRWTKRFPGIDRLLAAGADMRIDTVSRRINALRRKLAEEAVHRAEVPGIRCKVAPDPTLDPFTVKVPVGAFAVSDQVDLTRDPSLPVGNSTQRYQVVGNSTGNVIEVGADPWMSIQGGDFDGDDACLQQVTTYLFPDKRYDQTAVAAFRQTKMSRRHGVRDPTLRFQQALRSLDRPIGQNDLLARRLLEEGRLSRKARVAISATIQSAIDSAKHAVEIIDHGYRVSGSGHAIDAIRRGDWDAAAICGVPYQPLVEAATEVTQADLQPQPFNHLPIHLAWAEVYHWFPDELLTRVSEFAGACQERFLELCRGHATEHQINLLADAILVKLENAAEVVQEYVPDDSSSDDLGMTLLELGLLRRTSLHLAARVVRINTLKMVFDSEPAQVRS